MKTIQILFCFCVALPLGIYGAGDSGSEDPYQKAIRRHGDSVNMVMAMAREGQSINGVLRPMHFLGSGGVAFVFKGMRLEDDQPVAIKFINMENLAHAKREYEMYSYLYAINNTQTERYGIPTVYYYGQWGNFVVTAFTELEDSVTDRVDAGTYYNYDILLLTQQFIIQSKYIHSCGVRHDDIKLENILTHGCQSFLNDFDLASKMTEDNDGTTFLMASLRYHQEKRRVALDDWESFLYAMCDMASVPLEWFDAEVDLKTKKGKEAAMKMVGKMKANRDRIREVIADTLQGNEPLQVVLLALADEAFSKKSMPNYDKLYSMVSGVLATSFPGEVCFSWTHSDPDRHKIAESLARSQVDISEMQVPRKINDYLRFSYPRVNENLFRSAPGGSFGCSSCIPM